MATRIGKAKISNAFRGVRFNITKSDIERGQPNDPCGCAAALALRRHFDARETFVFRDVTYVLKKDGVALRYKTTAPLRLETIVYDREGQFFPGQYDLGPAPITDTKKASRSARVTGPKRRNSTSRHTIPNVRPSASQKLPGA